MSERYPHLWLRWGDALARQQLGESRHRLHAEIRPFSGAQSGTGGETGHRIKRMVR
jgi:hypothetical protein